jgi:plastocyanin
MGGTSPQLGRGLRLAIVVAALAVGLPAPARAATVTVAGYAFSPETVTIHPGDAVTWSWTGPDRNHTVTSDPGQAEGFESHPGLATPLVADGPPGETFSHTFTKTGAFTYFCRVHPYIRGKVTVLAAGAPPPDRTPPTTRLRILSASLRTVARSGRLRVTVAVDEPATVKLTARGIGRTIARRKLRFRAAGTKTVALRLTRATRRALTRRVRVRVTVSARARDSAGNVKTVRKSKALRSRASLAAFAACLTNPCPSRR